MSTKPSKPAAGATEKTAPRPLQEDDEFEDFAAEGAQAPFIATRS